MTVSDLIKKLQQLPGEKSVHCQVLGKSSGAWNMEFDVKDVRDSWMVLLAVTHHELIHLPDYSNEIE